jgi:cytochrome c oxidase subunit 4
MSTTETSAAVATDVGSAPPHDPAAHHHPGDLLYIQIAIILAAITAVEVLTYFVDFGPLQTPALLIMMAVKFAMVAMFFMHLKFDNKLFSWVFVAGLVLAVLVYIAMLTMFEFF